MSSIKTWGCTYDVEYGSDSGLHKNHPFSDKNSIYNVVGHNSIARDGSQPK